MYCNRIKGSRFIHFDQVHDLPGFCFFKIKNKGRIFNVAHGERLPCEPKPMIQRLSLVPDTLTLAPPQHTDDNALMEPPAAKKRQHESVSEEENVKKQKIVESAFSESRSIEQMPKLEPMVMPSQQNFPLLSPPPAEEAPKLEPVVVVSKPLVAGSMVEQQAEKQQAQTRDEVAQVNAMHVEAEKYLNTSGILQRFEYGVK